MRSGGVTRRRTCWGRSTYGYVGRDGPPRDGDVPERADVELQLPPRGAGSAAADDPPPAARAAATLSKFDYTYDAVGNILTWQQQADSAAPTLWRYGYDAADQLTARSIRRPTRRRRCWRATAYGYDPAGNRTFEQIERRGDGGVARRAEPAGRRSRPGGALQFEGDGERAGDGDGGRQAGGGGRGESVPGGRAGDARARTRWRSRRPTRAGTRRRRPTRWSQRATAKTFTYDANGNLTSDGTRTFEWDAQNQIVAVTVGTHRSEFVYDGLQPAGADGREGERPGPDRPARTSGCETAVCEERDAGRRRGDAAVLRAGRAGRRCGAVLRADHLGSVRELTDGAATCGRAMPTTRGGGGRSSRATSKRGGGFTGHPQHAASGLALTLYRGYDAALGRWVSEDPIGIRDGLNRYRYAANGPVAAVDPLGCVPVRTSARRANGNSTPSPSTSDCRC